MEKIGIGLLGGGGGGGGGHGLSGGNPAIAMVARKAATKLASSRALRDVISSQAQASLLNVQEQALQKNAATQARSVDVAESRVTSEIRARRLNMLGSLLKNIGILIKNLLKPIGIILRDLSPYIALAVVIIVLFFGWRIGRDKKKRSNLSKQRDKIFNSVKTRWQRFVDWFGGLFSFAIPGHYWRTIVRMMNPLAGSFTKLPRPRMIHGRCDQVLWRELGGDGQPGLCARTYAPKDMNWVMDTDKMPDMNRLPEKLYEKVTNNGRKLQVTIPWALQGTFYVPQCSKAVFADGTSAAGVLKDEGMACRKKEVTVPTFKERYRVKGGAMDAYATEADPKC